MKRDLKLAIIREILRAAQRQVRYLAEDVEGISASTSDTTGMEGGTFTVTDDDGRVTRFVMVIREVR